MSWLTDGHQIINANIKTHVINAKQKTIALKLLFTHIHAPVYEH